MAANTPVGNVTAMIIKSTEQASGTEKEHTITNSKMWVNPEATYTQIDQAARALNRLSYNTYVDTVLTTAVSVNEQVAE